MIRAKIKNFKNIIFEIDPNFSYFDLSTYVYLWSEQFTFILAKCDPLCGRVTYVNDMQIQIVDNFFCTFLTFDKMPLNFK